MKRIGVRTSEGLELTGRGGLVFVGAKSAPVHIRVRVVFHHRPLKKHFSKCLI